MTVPPYDQRLANEAAAAEQCMKLGAVLLKPAAPRTGFAAEPPPQPAPGQGRRTGTT